MSTINIHNSIIQFLGVSSATTTPSSAATTSTDPSNTESPFQDHPVHWILSESNRGVVEAEDTKFPKLRLSGDGVTFRNGHAILDGESGYFDGGDYRGECFSGKYRKYTVLIIAISGKLKNSLIPL